MPLGKPAVAHARKPAVAHARTRCTAAVSRHGGKTRGSEGSSAELDVSGRDEFLIRQLIKHLILSQILVSPSFTCLLTRRARCVASDPVELEAQLTNEFGRFGPLISVRIPEKASTFTPRA
eukprot:1894718-Pleurochrysis_carterae.AAC.1